MKEGICPIPLSVEDCGNKTDDECTLGSDFFGENRILVRSCVFSLHRREGAMISFMLATTLVVFIPSTLTEKQSLRCIATCRRTMEDGSCSKGDRMHLSASIAIGMTIDQASEILERISGWETTKLIVSPQQMRSRCESSWRIGVERKFSLITTCSR